MENYQFDTELIFAILNGKVSTAINRKLYRNFKKAGLEFTPEQFTVMACLWNKDCVTQQELCNATFKDKPSMTRLIDNMEKLNLVTRIADKADRRTNLIKLTSTGEAARPLASKPVLDTMQEAFQGVDPEELAAAKKVLKIIFENIRESL